MPPVSEVINVSKEAATQPDRTLFIFVILMMAAALVWIVRYLITDFQKSRALFQDTIKELFRNNAELAKSVVEAMKDNTAALALNSSALARCAEQNNWPRSLTPPKER